MERQKRTPNVLLRQARKRRGWTQRRLADEINSLGDEEGNGQRGAATGDMVRKWEQGIHPPSPFYLSRLCEVLGCTADQLGIGEMRFILSPPLVTSPAIDIHTSALWLTHLITFIDHWRSPHFHDLQQVVTQEIHRMDRTSLSRREALFALAALPTLLATLSSVPPLEEMLARYAASIAACWHLYFDGGAEEIKPFLAVHLPRLTSLAKIPSVCQKSAAILASQAYQLEWFLALQDRDFGKALFATYEMAP